jgi:ABC-type arginine transport system ATPase subunit
MNKEEETKLLKQAVEMWGTEAQLWMLIEESGELIKAVCKMHRASSDRHTAAVAFLDELVDVSVMIDQWKLEVGEERFDRARDLKMKRLKEKLFVYSEAHRTKPEMPWPMHINLRDFM